MDKKKNTILTEISIKTFAFATILTLAYLSVFLYGFVLLDLKADVARVINLAEKKYEVLIDNYLETEKMYIEEQERQAKQQEKHVELLTNSNRALFELIKSHRHERNTENKTVFPE